ncbi:MAG: hypothetical protein KDD25_03205, partial [Bdellovibrionales bacterium]|nr:hypothetical protein [Bdellovibrionales bacterium]
MLRNSFDFSKSLLKIVLIHAILVQSPISVASSYRPPPKAPGAPDFKTGQEAPESASQKFLDGEGKPVTAKIVSDGILLEFSDPNQESILIEKSSEEELKKVSPDAIRASAIEGAKSAGQHIRDGFAEAYRSFPMEALAFYTVMGAMAVYECWYKMRTNPMACDDFVKQLVDPVAQLSFYLFIATSKSVGNMVNGLNLAHYKKTGRFLLGKNLRHIIPYLGMAAGSLVSQISVEMWSDPNITYVRENMFSFDGQFGNKIDQEKYYKALFEAAKKWMNPGNLTAYAPHVLSLAFSMASASIVTGVAAAGLAKAGITQAYKQWERAAIKQFIRTSLSYGKDSAKYIWRMRGLRFTLRAGGFLLTVASFAHFFLWEHYYGPPITKWWNQEETAMKLRYYESAIADTLAEARSNSDEEFVENYTNIRRFLYDAIHTDSDISAQRKFLSENADDFGLTDSDVLDVDRLFMKQRNQNYIVRNHDYNEDLSPTLVQVPFLYSEKANKTFSKVPNFAMVTDPGKFNLLGSVVHKSRYDHLLNQIRDYITQVDSYQAALGSLFELTRNKWDEFFKPFTAWSLTTFQLYRHLVEMKKQRLFDKEDFW